MPYKDYAQRLVASRAYRLANLAACRARDAAYARTPKGRQVNKLAKRRANERYPEHKWARDTVAKAIVAGKLAKQPCEVCGTRKRVQAHHDDYSKPLDVRWLCIKHHKEHHATKTD